MGNAPTPRSAEEDHEARCGATQGSTLASCHETARRISSQAGFRAHAGTRGCDGEKAIGRIELRHSEACRDAPALRFPPRARRGAEELGDPEGPEPRSRREAPCRPCRGSPDRLWWVRGRHSQGAVWRRHCPAVGSRPLAAGRRIAGNRLSQRLTQIHPRRREAARQMGPRPHGREGRPREARELAPHQGDGRGRPAGDRRRGGRSESAQRRERPRYGDDRGASRPRLGFKEWRAIEATRPGDAGRGTQGGHAKQAPAATGDAGDRCAAWRPLVA